MGGECGEHAAGRLGTDFNEGVGGGIEAGAGEEFGAGGGDQFAKQRAEAGGGIEVGTPVTAHPGAVAPVVAECRIVEREGHEGVMAHVAGGAGGTGEGLRKLGGWRRGGHG